jgi:hypothetical protein
MNDSSLEKWDATNNPVTKVSDLERKNFQKNTLMNFVQVGLG